MQFSNETYDLLNKIHRGLLGIITAVSSILTLITALSNSGLAVPHIATVTVVLAVAKAILGEMLKISSKEYWDNYGDYVEDEE